MDHVRKYFRTYLQTINRLESAGDEEFEAIATELAMAGCPFEQLSIGMVVALIEYGSLKHWSTRRDDDRFRMGSRYLGAPQGAESPQADGGTAAPPGRP